MLYLVEFGIGVLVGVIGGFFGVVLGVFVVVIFGGVYVGY